MTCDSVLPLFATKVFEFEWIDGPTTYGGINDNDRRAIIAFDNDRLNIGRRRSRHVETKIDELYSMLSFDVNNYHWLFCLHYSPLCIT